MDLLVNKEFGLMRLSFNREAKRNSLNISLCNALRDALVQAQTDPAVRVVMLESEQEVFCAGADMEEMRDKAEALESALVELFDTLRHFTKPVIAGVYGPCVGEGVSLLLFADMVFASAEAVFAFPSTALAKIPRFGITEWASRCANPRLLAQKLLLSEPMNAQEALSIGLVTAVTDRDSLPGMLAEKAARLTVLPPAAVQATRLLLNREFLAALDKHWNSDLLMYEEQTASDEAAEALAAFLEKRAPVYTSN